MLLHFPRSLYPYFNDFSMFDTSWACSRTIWGLYGLLLRLWYRILREKSNLRHEKKILYFLFVDYLTGLYPYFTILCHIQKKSSWKMLHETGLIVQITILHTWDMNFQSLRFYWPVYVTGLTSLYVFNNVL